MTKWCYDDSDIEVESPKLVSKTSSDINHKKDLHAGGQPVRKAGGQIVRKTGGQSARKAGGGGWLPRVRVSQLSRSYLPPLRETERRGRQIEKLPGLI